jgi:hypothetical protein
MSELAEFTKANLGGATVSFSNLTLSSPAKGIDFTELRISREALRKH